MAADTPGGPVHQAPADTGHDASDGATDSIDDRLVLEALMDDQHPLKTATTEWARVALTDDGHVERDRNAEFWAEGWQRCAEHGIQGLVVPKHLGGQGRDLISALLILEGLGVGCTDNGLAYGLGSQVWSMQTALMRFGTDAQLEQWIPSLCDGGLMGGFAITEPESGSDTFSMTTLATERDGGWVLEGEKCFITLGPACEVFVVFATTDPALGRWGVSAFIVEADDPGVSVGTNREKSGMRTTPFGDLSLRGVELDDSRRLGPKGSGAAIFNTAMEAERAFVFATQVGAMERVLAETARFTDEREQFGQPIGDFQSISNRLADMKLRHETSRLLLYKTAALHQAGRPATMTAALAKLVASEAAVASALDAVRIHGARGYLSDYGVERELRDALGGVIYSGTSDIQRNIISGLVRSGQ